MAANTQAARSDSSMPGRWTPSEIAKGLRQGHRYGPWACSTAPRPTPSPPRGRGPICGAGPLLPSLRERDDAFTAERATVEKDYRAFGDACVDGLDDLV